MLHNNTIRTNVLRAALAAMENRKDVPEKTLRHYRRLLAESGTILRIVPNHGSHSSPSEVCDCYYGMVG